eukprot:scaffold318_cov396-Prasinococcus_capsulatus_cf.AAC.16
MRSFLGRRCLSHSSRGGTIYEARLAVRTASTLPISRTAAASGLCHSGTCCGAPSAAAKGQHTQERVPAHTLEIPLSLIVNEAVGQLPTCLLVVATSSHKVSPSVPSDTGTLRT